MTFIPGFSTIKGEPQDPEENAKTYAESQQQRALERKLREEKRDLEVMKAQGASPEEIKAQRERVRNANADIDQFCQDTGRARRKDREKAPVRADWPDAGGNVTRYNGGYIGTDVVPPPKGPVRPIPQPTPAPPTPSTPTPTPTIPIPAPQNVAPQATNSPKNVVQLDERKAENPFVTETLANSGIEEIKPEKLQKALTSEEIVADIGGADRTGGSCSSVAFAYAGNRAGYNVHDFRGGLSENAFSSGANVRKIAAFTGVDGITVTDYNAFKAAEAVLRQVEVGKEYYFAVAKHAAIVRKTESAFEYLELQSSADNGFHKLTNDVLRWRFGAKKSMTWMYNKVPFRATLMNVEKLGESPDFIKMLDYINTATGEQKKGVGGGIK